jgi:hypothetical protein
MAFRTLSFGCLETGVWGAVWAHDSSRAGFSLFGDGTAVRAPDPAAAINAPDDVGHWELSGQGVELRSLPESEPAAVRGGFDQLVRVKGRIQALGADRAIDCLGRRGARDGVTLEEFESVRDVAACFEPDQGLAVIAARPRGATSHADDVLSASAFEEGHALLIADPRLSTTYLADGLPARASFELWPEEAAAADNAPQEDDQEPRPRRAAGEVIGHRGSYEGNGVAVHAALFRWHSRGRQGAGVYVLARAR